MRVIRYARRWARQRDPARKNTASGMSLFEEHPRSYKDESVSDPTFAASNKGASDQRIFAFQ